MAEGGEGERLHKRIASSGLCSRRAAEQLILQGRVSVNGRVVTQLGTKVGPDDRVEVDGQPLARPKRLTLVMNKPEGVLTTLSDPRGRRTVAQLLPRLDTTVKPVGRLDMDTSGVLLFTNDGELAARLTHPRFGVVKEYRAEVLGVPDERDLERLRSGVPLDGRRTAPAEVELAAVRRNGQTSLVVLRLHEGRNRQVRRMLEAVGHPVAKLRRTKFGPISASRMAPGECRLLGLEEVNRLRSLVGLPPESEQRRARRRRLGVAHPQPS
ncbi:MAG: rRNA pseudouridine synthase [Fimbriimonadales bacterium]|nr:rRNA pseudouridine synthase [Fimbriimonadales bacterium]